MIIGFCNLKGGVGKTTSCQNIAAALTRLGKKIAKRRFRDKSFVNRPAGV